jgi:DcmR-like sensory protein
MEMPTTRCRRHSGAQLRFYGIWRDSGLLLVNSHSIYVVGTDPAPAHWRREISNRIMQNLLEGYAVVYVGDENEATALRRLSSGKSIRDYIEKGLLTIISRDVFYSPFVPSKMLLEQWDKLFANIEKKAGKGSIKGLVAMGMPADSFFISEADNRQLVRYESLASKRYDKSLEAMCLYTTEMIQRMPLRHIISLLNAHQNTGHRNGILRKWNSERGLSTIKRGLDSALGLNVAEMVMAVIVRDFDMNKESLILYPDKFEKKLAILLGTSAADSVINHIKMEIGNDIVY